MKLACISLSLTPSHFHFLIRAPKSRNVPTMSQDNYAVTKARVFEILDQSSWRRPSQNVRTIPNEFSPTVMEYVEELNRTDLHGRATPSTVQLNLSQQEERAVEICKSFLERMGNSDVLSNRLEGCDVQFVRLLTTNFELKGHPHVVVRHACNLLRRLPVTAAPLLLDGFDGQEDYLPRDSGVQSSSANRRLMTTRYIDSNTIRFALHLAYTWQDPSPWDDPYRKYVDLCGNLFAGSTKLSPDWERLDPTYVTNICLLRIFLWSAWQRSIMLYLWAVMDYHLNNTSSQRSGMFAIGNTPLLQRTMQRSSEAAVTNRDADISQISPYMCQWAFRLLRDDIGSVAQDFRQFHLRYKDAFGQWTPRCIFSEDSIELPQQCEGDSPFTCNRFKGMKITNQSAHAPHCLGTTCTRMFWDEINYKQTSGARAVEVYPTQPDKLTYRPATSATMAISHVWSHGQGGRPELLEENGTGFNRCLHERYSQLASTLACDTYWMDTPCIPQDHNLRREAIGHINEIFAMAKVTLVCDRDIMSIDIDPNGDTQGGKQIAIDEISIATQETLMATLLVCDWNLRAWTFLEAMRGSRSICLLCKKDNVVSLRDVINNVHHNGRIDISTLCVNALHLLPATDIEGWSIVAPAAAKAAGLLESVDLVNATYLLSHRHASRPGDEVVIWSLLCGKKPYYNATDLWSAHLGGWVPTEYLMNNLPRIQNTSMGKKIHLGWAPSRPNFPEEWSIVENPRYFSLSSTGNCANGSIMQDGLSSEWLYYDFNCYLSFRFLSARADSAEGIIHSLVKEYLWGYWAGALVRPCNHMGLPLPNRSTANGTLVAVLGIYWTDVYHWKAVIDWPNTIPLPPMQRERITIS